MIRILGFALLVAIVVSWISDGNGTVVAIAFLGVLGLFAYSVITGRVVLKCPYCLKRVKLGATHCHHCGRQVVSHRSSPGAPTHAVARFDPRQIDRACPSCDGTMVADQVTCPRCGTASEPWVLKDGTWWTQPEPGVWARLDPSTGRFHEVL